MFLPELYIAIFLIKVLIAAVAGCMIALNTNLVLKTRPYYYLASTTIIAVFTFVAVYFWCALNLQPLLWFERDDNWRNALWEYRPDIIATIVAAIFVFAWQYGVRKIGRCRIPI
jgi:hypothetical protein